MQHFICITTVIRRVASGKELMAPFILLLSSSHGL